MAYRLFLALSCAVFVSGAALYFKASRIYWVITHSEVVSVELEDDVVAEDWTQVRYAPSRVLIS